MCALRRGCHAEEEEEREGRRLSCLLTASKLFLGKSLLFSFLVSFSLLYSLFFLPLSVLSRCLSEDVSISWEMCVLATFMVHFLSLSVIHV